MIDAMPPAAIFIIGALLLPFLKGNAAKAYILLVPALAFLNMVYLPEGITATVSFMDYELILCKADRLSKVWGYIFSIMAFGGALYSIHKDRHEEMVAAFFYIGSSLGVVFAGDLITLFLYWEVMAIASTYIIWNRRTKKAHDAGFRYVIVHILGGLLLLSGIVMYIAETGTTEFGYIGLSGLSSWLIILGFAFNAAIPPFSAWLSDAYPESTVTGTVFLSAFTSKTAVYVLCRAFPGTELLIWAGAAMTLYGIIFAILENDMRRILAFSIINQVGFMIVGIGIGTELAINGTAAHAFAHILYKALLLMSAGSVLYMTGLSKCTELGGLYRTMPLTLLFGCIGAGAISAVPLTGGFISKSMIISAAGHEHLQLVWVILEIASAGVFLHAGIKFPYFVFFNRESGLRPKEPPLNMLLAMGFFSFLCIFIGVYPDSLYNILPYAVHYVPYTTSHVVGQLQLLMFSALAFFILLKLLKRTNTISIDSDWFYRKGTDLFLWFIRKPMGAVGQAIEHITFKAVPSFFFYVSKNPLGWLRLMLDRFYRDTHPSYRKHEIQRRIDREKAIFPGDIIKHWPIGATVLWVTVFLLACLSLYYL